jgi:hypothetical protein
MYSPELPSGALSTCCLQRDPASITLYIAMTLEIDHESEKDVMYLLESRSRAWWSKPERVHSLCAHAGRCLLHQTGL